MNLHAVDATSPVPLYEQLRRSFERQITSGLIASGSMLPTDREICEQYGVSRITVGRALADLVRMGLVRRIQGKGTVVVASRVSRSLDDLAGFTDTIRKQGLDTRASLLSFEAAGDDAPLETHALAGDRRSPIMRIKRLRYVDGRPAVITSSYMRESLAAQMRKADLETESFIEIFERVTGLKLARTERTITPVLAGEEEARLLEVPLPSAHFCFRSLTFLENDVFVEIAESIFRGDMFEFKAGVHRVRALKSGRPSSKKLESTDG